MIKSILRLVFHQPEIPQNVGALLRLSAAFQIPIDFIGPFSFIWSDRQLKRASLDYLPWASYNKYTSFNQYQHSGAWHQRRHVFLVPSKGTPFCAFEFSPSDALVLGSESCGFPAEIEAQGDHFVHIPMFKSVRSLNVAMTGAIVLTWALGKQNHFQDL